MQYSKVLVVNYEQNSRAAPAINKNPGQDNT